MKNQPVVTPGTLLVVTMALVGAIYAIMQQQIRDTAATDRFLFDVFDKRIERLEDRVNNLCE